MCFRHTYVHLGKTFVASEPSAFMKHTKEFIALEDGEVVMLKGKHHSFDRSRVEIAQSQHIETSPDPWPFWTIKGEVASVSMN